LDSLLKRIGLTELWGELRALLRRTKDWKNPPEAPAKTTAARSETPLTPATEPNMPKKPEAKSKKTAPARSKSAKSPTKARAAKTAAPASRKAAAKRSAKSSQGRGGASKAATSEAVNKLVEALRTHPNQKGIVTAGQQKDQLLRSLIPLYLARSLDLEVTSGTTSRFWEELGVSYAAPNAAKALRTHTGYAQETKKGRAITAKGVKYVEQAVTQASA
jgi:outer membrane biosynthesis protein TonB